MSKNLAYSDAYAATTPARVLQADDGAVLLDVTVFYPGGGGQPADSGWLRTDDEAEWRVTGARKSGDDIWHLVEGEGLPAVDTEVSAELDWDRRHALMRTHSALHVLCGVIWRDWGASVTGGNMEPLSGRMDFEFETMAGELVAEIERRVNVEIEADREIRVNVLPREEAFAIPDLIRTKINRTGTPPSTPGRPTRSARCARSRSSASTSRPMAGRTSRTQGRSAGCG